MSESRSLQGKTLLISGGSRGIGLAIALRAARDGANVALIAKTDQLHELYGPYRGFEAIAARRAGKDLVFLRYLYKCENFPVVFYFTFYRTPRGEPPTETSNSWRVIIVRFDTELELLAWSPDSK